jgi:pimeloyl-ACP methyl ester carboxylesterase
MAACYTLATTMTATRPFAASDHASYDGRVAGTDLVVREQYVATADGWSLRLRRTSTAQGPVAGTRPLLIVPGYGMNCFIFGFHPRGTSMERCLAEAGFEVWSMDLRAQGESRAERRNHGAISLRNYSAIDLPAAVDRVLASTRTGARQLVLVGCSLGGSIAYGHLALCRNPRVAGMVAMGAPLRWAEVHPVVRFAFSSPALAQRLRMSNTRSLVKSALPLLLRVPSILSLYMNAATIDLQHIDEMARTVEDPHPAVNRDIALWLRRGDLMLEGVNVTDALRSIDMPLLLVLPNRDGIVPERTALSVLDAWGGRNVEVLRVGDQSNWYAHANLFIANDAPKLVFDPLARWLMTHMRFDSPTASVAPESRP